MSIEASSMTGSDEPPSSSNLSIEIEFGEHSLGEAVDWGALAEAASLAAIKKSGCYNDEQVEIYIELVTNERSQELNRDYRGKDKPTNVLSFPGVEPDDLDDMLAFSKAGGPPVPLGDLIIAGDVVTAEAAEQQKPVDHHFAHLIVHGVLHLVGYDHIEDDEAEEMEALERLILAGLNIPDPYEGAANG